MVRTGVLVLVLIIVVACATEPPATTTAPPAADLESCSGVFADMDSDFPTDPLYVVAARKR